MTYANTDYSGADLGCARRSTWWTARARMHIMGDWTDGWFTSKKFTDYGWAPVPGTQRHL